jgi:hypothetical protein
MQLHALLYTTLCRLLLLKDGLQLARQQRDEKAAAASDADAVQSTSGPLFCSVGKCRQPPPPPPPPQPQRSNSEWQQETNAYASHPVFISYGRLAFERRALFKI